MALADQLVVIDTRAGRRDAALALLGQVRRSEGLVLRDAAVLVCHDGVVGVTVPSDDWPDRRRLSNRWWTALARTVARFPDRFSAALIEAGVSRSFLEEVAHTFADESAAAVLLARTVEIGLLTPGRDDPPCARVVYGLFPEAAVNDLCELTA